MEVLYYIALVVVLANGVFIGTQVSKKKMKSATMGWLRIDHSEPDEPTRMFVELKGVTPDMIASHKYVTFEVINESYLSQN